MLFEVVAGIYEESDLSFNIQLETCDARIWKNRKHSRCQHPRKISDKSEFYEDFWRWKGQLNFWGYSQKARTYFAFCQVSRSVSPHHSTLSAQIRPTFYTWDQRMKCGMEFDKKKNLMLIILCSKLSAHILTKEPSRIRQW